ncbi:hypothetical protein F2Q68_00024197 [Brassica cretica]|uniref:Uncharacterized protein n=1 Tax=Brassica cretica TaxID=69181 RepID=A0A8S9IEU2_BRACR|nr:hypothetical protein F2Q68_00024197 [Brassica cretica]
MGGFFSVPLQGDQVSKDVSHVSCFRPSYINSLEENLAAMQRDMEELKARQTDVSRAKRKPEVCNGLQKSWYGLKTLSTSKLKVLKSESITKTATKGNVTLDASAIEELQHLERLESLKIDIDISSGSALKKLFSAHGIEELCIRDLQRDEAHLVLPTTMEQLRKIVIKSCGVVEIEIGRESYDTFLILEHEVEEIISERKTAGEQSSGGTKSPFDKLERLELSNLPMLKSIYKGHLRFPCLKKIGVESFHLVLGVALVVMNLSSVTVMINGSVGR